MMQELSLGLVIEGAVALLLALTIGYCVVLNRRLKRLHADRDMLKQMIADLVGATNLANQAIKELKQSAVEADTMLTSRLDEAERFGVELANHVNSGSALIERISRIARAVREGGSIEPVLETNKVHQALEQLAARARERGNAA
ncbi:DUF6468 domain-containing protein [Devosia nitrariae]|uniref:DUF6468 domain-containing protein n=2 Tax=Devosia nitrariae TaxID=2071872 RepID=A0ABQ5WBS8_9HYPH|nr:hypothetical protein GCM10010862_45920 [Devosia nitrariae]